MASTQATHIGTQLDEHHSPETNGRMSVCRRCGAQTDDPMGLHHSPFEGQLAAPPIGWPPSLGWWTLSVLGSPG